LHVIKTAKLLDNLRYILSRILKVICPQKVTKINGKRVHNVVIMINYRYSLPIIPRVICPHYVTKIIGKRVYNDVIIIK
jgi:hypothetical protein